MFTSSAFPYQVHCLACSKCSINIYCFENKDLKKLMSSIMYFVLGMNVGSAPTSEMRKCGPGPSPDAAVVSWRIGRSGESIPYSALSP